METKEIKLTFTPLSRGRFRCNQTINGIRGGITKNCEKYKRMFTNRVNPQQNRPRVLSAKIDSWREWNCPACDRTNYHGIVGETRTCTYCYKQVRITGKK